MRPTHKTLPILAALALALCLSPAAMASSTTTTDAPQAGGTPSGGAPATPTAHRASMASWFGPGFYGNKTACGQTMSPTIVGVANRTLPCGTLVKFAYKGHTLVVPVLDRGPYAKGVEWDLTAGAAQELGLAETVKVGTRVVGTTANTPTLGVPAGALTSAAPGTPAADNAPPVTAGTPVAGGTAAG